MLKGCYQYQSKRNFIEINFDITIQPLNRSTFQLKLTFFNNSPKLFKLFDKFADNVYRCHYEEGEARRSNLIKTHPLLKFNAFTQ